MGGTTLVNIDLMKSEAVVAVLEKAQIHINAALWAHFPEYEDWRLVLASKDLDSLSQGEAYLKIYTHLSNAGVAAWNTPTMLVMKTTDPFVKALKKSLGKMKDVAGMRLGSRLLGDRYIDDAYAYKIA